MASKITSHVMWEGAYDVLLKIFSYLDAEDLISCEDTCVSWQCALLYKQVWKRALEFKVSLNNQWRIVLDLLAKNGALEGVSYRDQCRIISRRSQIIQKNWLSGRHRLDTIFESPFDNQVHWFRLDWSRYVDMDADSLLLMPDSGEFLHVYQLSTMTLIYEIKYSHRDLYFRIFQDEILCARGNTIVMFNFKKDTQLEMPNLGEVKGAFFGTRNRLITLSNYKERPHVKIWQKKGEEYAVVKTRHFTGLKCWKHVGMDDVFIAIVEVYDEYFQVNFIVIETLELKRCFSLSNLKTRDCQYESGLFFIIELGFLTVIDVTSREVLKRIHQKLHDIGSPEFPIKLNSQFLVLAVDGIGTQFFAIYKLEDVKNSQIVDVTPVRKIDVPKDTYFYFQGKLFVDELKILFMKNCNKEVMIVDFF